MNDLTPENVAKWDAVRLYSPGQIVIAAAIGSPIAGGMTMAQNFRALGDQERAKVVLQLSIAATILVLALAFALPEQTPSSLLPAIYAGAFYYFANEYQREAYTAHIEAGGAKQSNWRVAGVTIAGFFAVFTAVVALAIVLPDWFAQ